MGFRKVLEINWEIGKDLFVFNFDENIQLAEDLKFTKRNLLKTNATFFDLLGLISPITLQGKLLLKLLCISKTDWVIEELNDIIKQKFLKFSIDLKNMKQSFMSRHIFGTIKEQIFNFIQDGYFRGGSWIGGPKRPTLPKICHTYPTMMKLDTVITYLQKIQKKYESRDTTPEFCWHQHFFTGN